MPIFGSFAMDVQRGHRVLEQDRYLNCEIIYLPAGFTVTARQGDTILDAALDHGVEIAHECGGNCACTTCHVRVRQGMECLSPMEAAEADRLSTAEHLSPESRLSCQALLRAGRVVVEIVI
jgi:2Fe-2S ferredoxin